MRDIVVGVVGQGFVGNAVATAFTDVCECTVETYDKYIAERSTTDIAGLAERCDIVFVCVPTPSDRNNRCSVKIVTDVVTELYDCISTNPQLHRCHTIVIKSTVPPRTTVALLLELHAKAPHVTLVFNPEFLNARSAYVDFVRQDHVVLGVAQLHPSYKLPTPNVDLLVELYTELTSSWNDPNIIITSAENAEIVKYVRNCFFATKVSFFNEVKQLCDAMDVNYDDMIHIVRQDDRVGFEHTRVPGPSPGAGSCDGQLMPGFGGMCLPKDLQEFIGFMHDFNVEPTVMEAAWQKNLEVRSERDWEHVPGAIIGK
jgi:UDPglucose 6-dehydrogenase